MLRGQASPMRYGRCDSPFIRWRIRVASRSVQDRETIAHPGAMLQRRGLDLLGSARTGFADKWRHRVGDTNKVDVFATVQRGASGKETEQGSAHFYRVIPVAPDWHHETTLSTIFKEAPHCMAQIAFRQRLAQMQELLPVLDAMDFSGRDPLNGYPIAESGKDGNGSA